MGVDGLGTKELEEVACVAAAAATSLSASVVGVSYRRPVVFETSSSSGLPGHLIVS